MKINHLIAFLFLLAATSCASTRKSTEINPPFVASESTWLYRDAEVVTRRLKPLERPQVRFDVEHAILHGDSVWVVVRATIPHRSIRRGECFMAISVLQDGDVAVATRPGRMQNLYLSWRFAWDERMRMNTFIVVFASLTDGRHLFQYLPLMLPLFWIDDTEDEFYWPRSAEIPEEALLDRSPFETAVE